MSSSLIIYSSTDGHTKRICERIAGLLDSGEVTKVISLEDANGINLSPFNKIIIGASIRYGRHSKNLYKFINLNKDILDKNKAAFFL